MASGEKRHDQGHTPGDSAGNSVGCRYRLPLLLVWESYWKVENGIRLSGMPRFNGQLTEKQIWQVTVLVKNADKIPESVKKELAAGASTPMEMAMPENPAAKPKKK